jgi:hypothetical protein
LRTALAAGRDGAVEILSRILLGRLHLDDLQGEFVDALPQQIEIGWRRCNHFLSRHIAVGLPSQHGNGTNEKRDQIAGEGERGKFAEKTFAVKFSSVG